MSRLKKLWKLLSSMKFGMLLLGVLAAACVFGSVIPQGNSLDWYLDRYPQRSAALIYGLRLDDVFHSLWFLILTVILCCNLLLCNLLHLPPLLRRWRNAADPDRLPAPTVTVEGVREPAQVFSRLGISEPAASEREGKRLLVGVKNRVGLWGAWVCHLGILLLVVGFVLGQSTKAEYTVYGVPGQTRPVGETGYLLTIEDFSVTRTEAGNTQQYTTRATMTDPATGLRQTDTASVNDPGDLFGYRVYQNSTGPAAKVTVTMDGKIAQEEVLCVGDYLYVMDTPLILFLDGYDAEYLDAGDGTLLPGYVYSAYYMGQLDRSGVQAEGDTDLRYGSVEITFSEPQSYTLLQLKQDHYQWLVLLGGLVILLGLILAFYLQPRRLWACQEANGAWTLYGESRKGGALFAERVREAAGQLSDQR